MKVIVNKHNNSNDIEKTCEYCHSIIAYNKNDLYFNYNDANIGGLCIDCPCCGKTILIEKCSIIDYEKSFYHFHNPHTVKISNEEIKQWIKEGLSFLQRNPQEDCWETASGDSRVDIIKYEGDEEYSVCVSKNYWCNTIPFDKVSKIINSN